VAGLEHQGLGPDIRQAMGLEGQDPLLGVGRRLEGLGLTD